MNALARSRCKTLSKWLVVFICLSGCGGTLHFDSLVSEESNLEINETLELEALARHVSRSGRKKSLAQRVPAGIVRIWPGQQMERTTEFGPVAIHATHCRRNGYGGHLRI